MQYFSMGRGAGIFCFVLWSWCGAQAQTLDTSFGTNGVLTINQFPDDFNRCFFLQGNRLLAGTTDLGENGFNVVGITLDGQFDPAFNQIGDGFMNSVPMAGFDQGFETSTGRQVFHTEERTYFALTAVGSEGGNPEQLRTSITAYDPNGELANDFGTYGKMTLPITTPGNFWSNSGGTTYMTETGFTTITFFYDTLAINKINFDGTPNASYGVNGVHKLEFSNLFGVGENYGHEGSIVIGEDVHVLFKKDNSIDGTFNLRILKLSPTNEQSIYNLDWAVGYLFLNLPMTPKLHSYNGAPYIGWKPEVDSDEIVLSRCTNDWMEEFRFEELYGYGRFIEDAQGRLYRPIGSGVQEPFSASCVRYTPPTSADGGQVDTSFGVNGTLTYSTQLNVEGVEFVNVDFTEDALYFSAQIGEINTTGGSQDVLILKYNLTTTSISESEETPFTLFPNPANESISILNATGEVIEVYSADGRLILSQPIKQNATIMSMDVSGLPSGIYFLKQKDHQTQQTARFIKQ